MLWLVKKAAQIEPSVDFLVGHVITFFFRC